MFSYFFGSRPTIKIFDVDNMKTHSLSFIVGNSYSGKSLLCKDIINHKYKDLSKGKVVSLSEAYNLFYTKFLPNNFVSDKYDADDISNILDEQISNDLSQFIVLDDVINNLPLFSNDELRQLVVTSGSNNILTLITSQTFVPPPYILSNIDYIFITKVFDIDILKKIYHKYCQELYSNFNEFHEIVKIITTDYQCLVIDKTQNVNKVILFYYKANKNNDIKLYQN